jgi:hypothetical protein
MNELRQLLMIAIVGNLIVGVWHLFLVTKILAPPDNSVNWTAIGLMTVGHLAVLGFVWKLAQKWAGVVSLAFFLAAVGVVHPCGPQQL